MFPVRRLPPGFRVNLTAKTVPLYMAVQKTDVHAASVSKKVCSRRVLQIAVAPFCRAERIVPMGHGVHAGGSARRIAKHGHSLRHYDLWRIDVVDVAHHAAPVADGFMSLATARVGGTAENRHVVVGALCVVCQQRRRANVFDLIVRMLVEIPVDPEIRCFIGERALASPRESK